MNIRQKGLTCIITIVLFFTVGCGEPVVTKELAPTVDLGSTIGSLAEVFLPDAIPVEGYALVGGLNGAGSSECPPRLREYLGQYILRQLPEYGDVDRLISSVDTAVVLVRGMMPAMVSKNQYFDVGVVALSGTQTTSLEGGWLYGADLYEAGRFGRGVKVLAVAKGPVFIDTIGASGANKKAGYILAGGIVLEEYKIGLVLRGSDYRLANAIRNRLNELFGPDTAGAISPGAIVLKVPSKYKGQKQRFISLIKATYLTQTQEAIKERIRTSVIKLITSEDKEQSEIALEAIGNESIDNLAALLNSSDEQVRFRAARCMLNLGSDLGLNTLRQIATSQYSSYRVEALDAIAVAASRNDVSAIARILLRDDDFDIRLAAYEKLRKLDDILIIRRLIGRSFYLEQIAQTEQRSIFVSRSGWPRIVLFGAPLYCRDNVFVQSADGNITINAPAGQRYISIMRRHPKRPNVIVRLRSSFGVSDIIRALCEEPIEGIEQGRRGLNVSYSEAILLLKRMCEKGAIQAAFRAGPLPKID